MAIQRSIIAIATIPFITSGGFRKKNFFVAFTKLKAFFVSQINLNVNKVNFYSLQK
jgi:hypothetical protein